MDVSDPVGVGNHPVGEQIRMLIPVKLPTLVITGAESGSEKCW